MTILLVSVKYNVQRALHFTRGCNPFVLHISVVNSILIVATF